MLKSVVFTVTGNQRLHCTSCEQRVTRIVKGLTGVREVRASASSQRIEVLFDSSGLDESAVAECLDRLGYATEASVQRVAPMVDSIGNHDVSG